MGIDSHIGRDGGRDVGRDIDRNGKNGEFPSPFPYIGSKWSRVDFDSYFEHKIDPTDFGSYFEHKIDPN